MVFRRGASVVAPGEPPIVALTDSQLSPPGRRTRLSLLFTHLIAFAASWRERPRGVTR